MPCVDQTWWAYGTQLPTLYAVLQVYVSYLKPLEWTMNHEEHDGKPVREDNAVFCKLITHTPDSERVVGVHYLGPHAGEITQVRWGSGDVFACAQ